MTFNDWSKEIHANAVRHGWWDEERSFGDIVALCHSELSEALEEYRAGRGMVWHECKLDKIDSDECIKNYCANYYQGECVASGMGNKPEGIAVEMIDCIIRILDWCGKESIDVDALMERKHEYNKTRPYRHGNKKL